MGASEQRLCPSVVCGLSPHSNGVWDGDRPPCRSSTCRSRYVADLSLGRRTIVGGQVLVENPWFHTRRVINGPWGPSESLLLGPL